MLNKDERRCAKNIALNILFPMWYVLRGGGGKKCFCLFNVCPCYTYANIWEDEICVNSLWEALSEERYRLKLLTGQGVGHQSCNRCGQRWCKLGAERGMCEQPSASPSPPPHPLNMCHLNKYASIRVSIKPRVAKRQQSGRAMFNSVQFNSVPFNSIQFNSVQFNSIQFSSIQFISIQFSSIQFHSIQFSSIQFNLI